MLKELAARGLAEAGEVWGWVKSDRASTWRWFSEESPLSKGRQARWRKSHNFSPFEKGLRWSWLP